MSTWQKIQASVLFSVAVFTMTGIILEMPDPRMWPPGAAVLAAALSLGVTFLIFSHKRGNP